jgi:hypothetical protein
MFRSTLICLAAALAGLVSLVASATTAAGQPQQGTTRWPRSRSRSGRSSKPGRSIARPERESHAASTARSIRQRMARSRSTFIHPGGHVYPGWAPAEIVKFLKSHRMNGA